jgi:anaerobic ribonucleoside-triphosphate reductase activating protein
MLKYANSDIVFQELPDEVTLAVNLTGCPCRCPGCHSKYLWDNDGKPLDCGEVERMLEGQKGQVTCLSFMGGDAEPQEVDRLAAQMRQRYPNLHISWWSGRSVLSSKVNLNNFDYIKLGPYLRHLGPLKSPTTNQRLYKVQNGKLHDITRRLQRRTGASK